MPQRYILYLQKDYLVFARKRQILRYSCLENSHPVQTGLLDFQGCESLDFDVFLSKTQKKRCFLAGTTY